jgi:membrane associated rhomboid family serine protease
MRHWLGRFGSVTQFILWITVGVFLVQLLCLVARLTFFESLFALSAVQLKRGLVWQLFTYMFLHDTGNVFHILINLLVLWFFGREVEYFIGPKYFTRLYFGAGLIGALLWSAFNFNSASYLLGASAAVLGCVIAFATLFPEREVTLLLFFIIPITLKAKYLALIAIAFDIVPLLSGTGGGVAHLAHLGGAAVGYVYIKHLGYGRTPRWLSALQSLARPLRSQRRGPLDPDSALSDEEYIRQRVDPILDKIAREGIQSLTRRERKILDSAKDHIHK